MAISNAVASKRLSKVVGCEVLEYTSYLTGFSFGVKTELEAYKAAYVYRNMPRVSVYYTESAGYWVVAVYNDKG